MTTPEKLIQSARTVIATEIAAIEALYDKVDSDAFIKACELLLNCRGRITVMGMGKSGHIARKIAATLASTGSPAFFIHPAEASHGDFGMLTKEDIAIIISHSGETREILTLLPLIKRLGIPMITLTGNPLSTLSQEAAINLNIGDSKEACPFNLAPTSSTTATLVIGDALAIALVEARGFTQEEFARTHPGGRLGRRLLLRVKDIMHMNHEVPSVSPDVSVSQALLEMTEKALGMTGIIDTNNKLIGIFTDGDLRRALDQEINVHNTKICDVMTKNCITANEDMLAAEALQIMEDKKINSFLVTNKENELIGAFNFLDLLRAGVT